LEELLKKTARTRSSPATQSFEFDVFLGHGAQDRSAVRTIAERLREDRVRVWLDEWAIGPGEDAAAAIEQGLERSRVLILCTSREALDADWATVESHTFRFRDPLNGERRLVPLRLDDAVPEGPLAEFPYIDWNGGSEEAYADLLQACRAPDLPETPSAVLRRTTPDSSIRVAAQSDDQSKRETPLREERTSYAFNSDCTLALVGVRGSRLELRRIVDGALVRSFDGFTRMYASAPLAWSPDEQWAAFPAGEGRMAIWNRRTDEVREWNTDIAKGVLGVAFGGDHRRVLVSDMGNVVRLWDTDTGSLLRTFEGHSGSVYAVEWGGGDRAVTAASDGTLRVWDVATGHCERIFEGVAYWTLAWGPDRRWVAAGESGGAVRIWDVADGRRLQLLTGHGNTVLSIVASRDGRYLATGSYDGTTRIWSVETGEGICVLDPGGGSIRGIAWDDEGQRVLTADGTGAINVWDVSDIVARAPRPSKPSRPAPSQTQYTNAKVLLVGDSGAGKSGLALRLSGQPWQPTASTVGAWATQWPLQDTAEPGRAAGEVEREIWLWDFGGQADQRLIHQLYMDETSLALLVFDGQKEALLETLGQWDRDITRAAQRSFAKLLVAGRIDAGGLRVPREDIERFKVERGFADFVETSAKTGDGCKRLRDAVIAAIDWSAIPCRTTEMLFKRLKEAIVRFKDDGRTLFRFNELRLALQLSLPPEHRGFTDDDLRAVLKLLAGPGVVWELAFGSWVLLQPEQVNAYAQAVLRTLQADEHQRGCIMEDRVLTGDLIYSNPDQRLPQEDERIVLLAMHQTLVERGLCLRQPTDQGNLLIFPAYYRRDRPERVVAPAVLVSYTFAGFLDEIYATLIVRLHHAGPFKQDQLWRDAADLRTQTGQSLGIRMTRRAAGEGVFDLYFDPSIPPGERIIFSRYVHDHLRRHAAEVARVRHYICPHCDTPVGNREIAMRRLNDWLHDRAKDAPPPTILCVQCEERLPLWDEIERAFADPVLEQPLREMEQQAAIVLDNESKERILVGEVISTVANAGQISREFTVSDHGIDMEIEFKDDQQRATGRKLYLQLKSGESHLKKRKKDGAEIFAVPKARHARYWMDQAFPVFVVVRGGDGDVRWMEVREPLREETARRGSPPSQIVFAGERFDVMAVRRWRERTLGTSK
jgi:small GTP-binding protein